MRARDVKAGLLKNGASKPNSLTTREGAKSLQIAEHNSEYNLAVTFRNIHKRAVADVSLIEEYVCSPVESVLTFRVRLYLRSLF